MVKLITFISLLFFPFFVKGQSFLTKKNKKILSETIAKISKNKENKNSVVRMYLSENKDNTVVVYVFNDSNFYLYENYFYLTRIDNNEVVITSDIMTFLPANKFDYFYIFKKYFPKQYDKFLSDYHFLGENHIFKPKINNKHKGIALYFRENQFLRKEKRFFEIKEAENPFKNLKNEIFTKEFNRISRDFGGITEIFVSKTEKGFTYKISKIKEHFSNREDFFIELKQDSASYILTDKTFSYIGVDEKEKLMICKKYFNKDYQYFLKTGEFLSSLPPNDEKKPFSVLHFKGDTLDSAVDENYEIETKISKFLKKYDSQEE